MRPRFVIALSPGKGPQSPIESCRALLPADSSMFTHCRFHALVQGCAAQPLGARGLLIGTLFKRGSAGPVLLGEADQQAAVASRGKTLIRQYWGAYVAVLADEGGPCLNILRAPLGDLPCYWARAGDAYLFASDVALLRAAGVPIGPIDRTELARHLAAEDLRRPETCLENVRELAGGVRIAVDGGLMHSARLWSPWTFAGADRQIHDGAEAARRVRDAALHCVQARSTQFGPVLLKLSGGLDSSIVAACLSAAGADFTALNLVTVDPSGDEREHARAVARSLGVELTESMREVAGVTLERSASARLPRPSAHSFTQESARLAAAAAERVGASVLFDGGGGDNIFCSLQSARPVADCLLGPGAEGQFWNCARTIARLTQASVMQIGWRSFLISRRRSPGFGWVRDLRFLSEDARRLAAGATDHPWLDPPAGALPGKAAQVALIAGAQSVVEGFDSEAPLASCSPLIAQPLVEACLAVPTWQWFDNGHNRAVARQAFVGYLPQRTLRRRSKGAPDCFIAELYESNLALIRTMIMDGVLRRLGLLDENALSPVLASDAPVEGNDYLRIMQLVDAEAWARAWQ
jgi:asparagine synthase (glutamine-hydrolysing)